jgi:hypothetical protein
MLPHIVNLAPLPPSKLATLFMDGPFAVFRHRKKALTEMVSNLIGAPDFWSTRNLVPKKFGSRMKIILQHLMQGPNFGGPNFLGTKFLKVQNSLGSSGPNEIGDHFSYSFKKNFTPMLI